MWIFGLILFAGAVILPALRLISIYYPAAGAYLNYIGAGGLAVLGAVYILAHYKKEIAVYILTLISFVGLFEVFAIASALFIPLWVN